ncbi:glycosyltransferase [Moraxella oblonga]|uniref:glycosyltransferase n=1 Tax=Moraxella oblonga TaxID=200413 RepID=UPI00082D04DB|nr:glycosyltransferase [Moraxella oblonga]
MTTNIQLPTIHALWIGKQLGKMPNACLSSFIKQGHQVILHCYDEINDIPNGVQIADGNLIIPQDKIIKHKQTGSYALFSDIFRYELLRKVDGVYVDCDVYCLKPIIIPEHGYLFGFEDDTKINGAVLALPKNSELLNKLIEISYDTHFIPPWYPQKKQKRYRLKKYFGFSKHISEMPWGVIGPDAITYFAKYFKVDKFAQDIDIFYPVHYNQVSMLCNGHLELNDITTRRTLCIHLYNEMLRHINPNELNQNSFLYKILNNISIL